MPAAMRGATGTVRQLGPQGGPLAPFVHVPYHGHALYYCAAEDVLLWECAPNTYKRIGEARLLAALAATPPTDQSAPARLPAAAARPDPAPQPVLDPAWDLEAFLASVQADQAQEAARAAAFEQALWEGLRQPEPGLG